MGRTSNRVVLVVASLPAVGLVIGACTAVATEHGQATPNGPDAADVSQVAPPYDGAIADEVVLPAVPDDVSVGPATATCPMINDAAPDDDVRIEDAGIEVDYVDAGPSVCPPVTSPALCGGLCGNGVRDFCQDSGVFSGGSDGGAVTSREDCDGTDLGGATCASLGFAGGTLGCDSSCHLDTSQCQTCAPSVAPAAGCSQSPQAWGPQVWAVGLAASATEIGFATVERNPTCVGVRFDRYAPNLARISESSCLGACDVTAVRVAPTASGWLLAMVTAHGLDLMPLDGQGTVNGSVRTIANVYQADLVPRTTNGAPLGGPLLIWTDIHRDHLSGALLRDDGTVEQSPVNAFATLAGEGAGVFTGDGYLLSGDTQTVNSFVTYDWTAVRRFRLDGSLGSVYAPIPCLAASSLQLAWTGSEVRATYTDENDPMSSAMWARLGQNGRLIESPQALGIQAAIGSHVVMLGADMLVLVDVTASSYGDPEGYYSVHVAGDGGVSAPMQLTTRLGYSEQLVALGTQGVAAWLTAATFGVTAGSRATLVLGSLRESWVRTSSIDLQQNTQSGAVAPSHQLFGAPQNEAQTNIVARSASVGWPASGCGMAQSPSTKATSMCLIATPCYVVKFSFGVSTPPDP